MFTWGAALTSTAHFSILTSAPTRALTTSISTNGAVGAKHRAPRLCGGGFGGEIAGSANGQGNRRNHALDSSVQSSTGDAIAAIGAITPSTQDINAHTSQAVRAIEQQELATGEISYNVASAAAGSKAAVAALGDGASE